MILSMFDRHGPHDHGRAESGWWNGHGSHEEYGMSIVILPSVGCVGSRMDVGIAEYFAADEIVLFPGEFDLCFDFEAVHEFIGFGRFGFVVGLGVGGGDGGFALFATDFGDIVIVVVGHGGFSHGFLVVVVVVVVVIVHVDITILTVPSRLTVLLSIPIPISTPTIQSSRSGHNLDVLTDVHFLQFIGELTLKDLIALILTDFGRVGAAILTVFACVAGGNEIFDDLPTDGSFVRCEAVAVVDVVVIVVIVVALMEGFGEVFVDAGCGCLGIQNRLALDSLIPTPTPTPTPNPIGLRSSRQRLG